jgi:GNAT superfamily N-acetyltransferase
MDLLSRPFFVAADDWAAVPLDEADAPALQDFLDANPLYSEIVNGRPFRPDEARQEIVDRPPFPHRAAHALAVLDRRDGRWRGFVSLVDDLIAPGVQHIGLFLIATAEHGSGLAQAVYDALEGRARGQGMRWMRLGVVVGHARAEAFWRRQGLVELRQRHGMPYEGPSTSVRVMVKPLHAGESDWGAYFAQVPRDRPDSP